MAKYDIAFTNDSGEQIPAFAVMELKKPDCVEIVGGRIFLKVDKPTADASGAYLINSAVPVKDGARGRGTRSYGVRAALDGDSDPVETGDSLSPKDDTWALERDPEGTFVAVGEIDDAAKTLRVQIGVSGGGGDEARSVLIISTVGGASWDAANQALTPVEVLALSLSYDEEAVDTGEVDENGDPIYEGAYTIGGTASFLQSWFTSPIVVDTGWYLIGLAVGQTLFNIDCRQVPGDTIPLG